MPHFETISPEDSGMRLDRWCKRHAPHIPRSLLEKLLRKGAIRVNGKRAKSDTVLLEGQAIKLPEIEVRSDKPQKQKPVIRTTRSDAEKLLLKNILYEDKHCFVINKPYGLATQGGTGIKISVDALLEHLPGAEVSRPKLVHRLDKDTSGALIIAKNQASARMLMEHFRSRDMIKLYWAIVTGHPLPEEGNINMAIQSKKENASGQEKSAIDEDAGKPARTIYKVLDHAANKMSFVLLRPLSGRMHQLRIHMQSIGHPILGDGKYGGKEAFIAGLSNKMHLHSRRIIIDDFFGKRLDVEAPLTGHMLDTFSAFSFDTSDRHILHYKGK